MENQSGTQPPIINQPQTTNTNESLVNKQQAVLPKKPGTKRLIIVVLVTLLIALSFLAIIGAYYLGKKMDKSTIVNTASSTPATPANNTVEGNLKIYSNNDLSFKYSKDYTLSGDSIKINNSNIQIDVVKANAPIGAINCAVNTDTQNVNNVYVLKYAYEKGQSGCETINTDQRQIWIVPSIDALSPAIILSFPAADEIYASQVANQIIPTVKFNK